jgi:hypothetical protein
MDKQECPLLIGSYGHTSDEMVYDGKYYHPQERQRPLAVTVRIQDLAEKEKMVEVRNSSGHVVAIYSVFGFKFLTERGIQSFIFRTYFPAAIGVFVSWVSFMIEQSAVAGRMALLVTLSLMEINLYKPLTEKNLPSGSVSIILLLSVMSFVTFFSLCVRTYFTNFR